MFWSGRQPSNVEAAVGGPLKHDEFRNPARVAARLSLRRWFDAGGTPFGKDFVVPIPLRM